jgi:hypothetical protein
VIRQLADLSLVMQVLPCRLSDFQRTPRVLVVTVIVPFRTLRLPLQIVTELADLPTARTNYQGSVPDDAVNVLTATASF